MEQVSCGWSPQLIIEGIKAIAWPLTVLVIFLRFRSGITGTIRSFFSKSSISELSASPSGVSAKFIADKQSSGALEAGNSSSISLPNNSAIESINERHALAATEFSDELLDLIKTHIQLLNLSAEEASGILMKELSLIQSQMRYFDISKILFRSQFDLFSLMLSAGNYILKEDVCHYFDSKKEITKDALVDWDCVKYMAYPVSVGLLTADDDVYRLSKLGRSYLSFMNKNPQFIDELPKM